MSLQVWCFVTSSHDSLPSEFDTWFGYILAELTELRMDFMDSWTKVQIVDQFEQSSNRAFQEAVEDYQDDPQGNPDPKVNHPWGNIVMARCRKFIETATPYSVWKLKQDIQVAAEITLGNTLTAMAFLDLDGQEIAKATQKAREEAVRALKTELNQQVPK